jgi:hypothetical protein
MKNILLAFVCAVVASPAFAQTRDYQRTPPGAVATEGVTVTGTFLRTESGTVLNTHRSSLVVLSEGISGGERYVLEGPGHVFDRFGQPVSIRAIQPGKGVRVIYAIAPDGARVVDHLEVL